MAELTHDHSSLSRLEAYRLMSLQLDSLLEGVSDEIARMSTIACVLHHGLGTLWTGFYRRTGSTTLEVGPYQGTLGCLRIEYGRGVCGQSAQQGRTLVVKDVDAFPGHITCDSRARSEIVVPVFDSAGELRAVLDLDSDRPEAFDEADARELEALVARYLSLEVV